MDKKHLLSAFNAMASRGYNVLYAELLLDVVSKKLADAGLDPSTTEGRLLDVGTGDGLFPQRFCKRYPEWHAHLIDAIEDGPRIWQRRGFDSRQMHVLDIETTAFPLNLTASFDLALSYAVLPYLERPYQAISELVKTTKPGGVVLFSCMAHDGGDARPRSGQITAEGEKVDVTIYSHPMNALTQACAGTTIREKIRCNDDNFIFVLQRNL